MGLEISKEDMAAYLGITISSLNRSLKNLNAYSRNPVCAFCHILANFG
jgi:hypothetical protein